MVIHSLLLLASLGVVSSSAARENRKGLDAWQAKDTAGALSHLERAARDTTDPRYGYNLGTVRSMARDPHAEEAFDQALRAARSRSDSARILYNRGTNRLQSAKAGPGQTGSAVQDLRDALRCRPGWKDAARNLELALKQNRQKDDKGGKDQDKKKQDKQDQKKPKPGDDQKKQDPKDQPQPTGMSKQDADRLLDAARAQEGKQARKPARKVESDGPDW